MVFWVGEVAAFPFLKAARSKRSCLWDELLHQVAAACPQTLWGSAGDGGNERFLPPCAGWNSQAAQADCLELIVRLLRSVADLRGGT